MFFKYGAFVVVAMLLLGVLVWWVIETAKLPREIRTLVIAGTMYPGLPAMMLIFGGVLLWLTINFNLWGVE